MLNLVKTHVQSSVRHLEAIYRERKGKSTSDLEMEHFPTLGSVNWLSFLAPKEKFAELYSVLIFQKLGHSNIQKHFLYSVIPFSQKAKARSSSIRHALRQFWLLGIGHRGVPWKECGLRRPGQTSDFCLDRVTSELQGLVEGRKCAL